MFQSTVDSVITHRVRGDLKPLGYHRVWDSAEATFRAGIAGPYSVDFVGRDFNSLTDFCPIIEQIHWVQGTMFF